MRKNSKIPTSKSKPCTDHGNQLKHPPKTEKHGTRKTQTQPQQHQVRSALSADVNLHSVHLNDSVQSSNKNDVFKGVNYKRNARYFLSVINSESTKDGIFNYIESKCVKVTHMILFKPRSTRSQLTAKINVLLGQADRIETFGLRG